MRNFTCDPYIYIILVARHFCQLVQRYPPKAVLRLDNDLYLSIHIFVSFVLTAQQNDLFCLYDFHPGVPGLRSSTPCNLTPAQAYAARWDLSPVPRSTVIVPRREASLDTPSNRTNSVSNANSHLLQPNQTSKQHQPTSAAGTEPPPSSTRLRTKTCSLDCGLEPKSVLPPSTTMPSSAMPPCTMPVVLCYTSITQVTP